MNRILSWLITPLHLLGFGAILLIFHFIQLAGYIIGYRAHKWTHQIMCYMLLLNLRFFGNTKLKVSISNKLPLDRPIIFVANHQSLYDIPFFYWHLRRFHPKFVAKKELGRWIPGVSIALRNLGDVLIDRQDPRQSIKAVKQLGKLIKEKCWSACIFPEGTRARDGVLKEFKAAGILALLDNAPGAVLAPVAIKGSWEIVANKMLPVPFGKTVSFTVLDPLDPADYDRKFLTKIVEKCVQEQLQS